MIKLSKKGSYALKAVICISKSDSLIKISDIASSQAISEALLRRIIADLERVGIVSTIKGRSGGVQLGRDAAQVSIYDILFSVGEELGITECTRGEYCEKQIDCITTDLLGGLQKGFNSLLKMYTLDKL